MIQGKVFWEALARRKTFVATKPKTGASLHKKLRKLEDKYLNSPGIPAGKVREYIRIQLTIEIGQVLSIRGINRVTLDFSNHPDLECAWNRPLEYFDLK
jgi:hypothetical protein